jgi:molybdate transport system substrate-binding protein
MSFLSARSALRVIFAAGVLLLLANPLVRAAEVPAIAAAADLKFALIEVAERFRQETGRVLKLSFGSSGNFTHQIEQGAPFEIFLSADESYVFRLADRGLTRDRGALYAIGRVVLFAPHGSSLSVENGMPDLQSALASGRVKRFAIANPDHAPYGRAARAVLQQSGMWSAIQPRLTFGENASQAMQFAASGTCQGGIVPLSLSTAPEVARLGSFAPIPAELHAGEPLRQRMVLLSSAGDTARAFYAYLGQPEAREIFVRYGFTLPGEERP